MDSQFEDILGRGWTPLEVARNGNTLGARHREHAVEEPLGLRLALHTLTCVVPVLSSAISWPPGGEQPIF